MDNLPEIIAAFGFFGMVVILPLVFMLMKHQRAIAASIYAGAAAEAFRRLEALEYEMRELRSSHHEQLLRLDDASELSRRRVETPPVVPLVEP